MNPVHHRPGREEDHHLSHLPFTIPCLKVPGEMNGYLRVQDDVTAVGLRTEGADLLPPEGPGLGATRDPEKLCRYAVRRGGPEHPHAPLQ